MRLSTTALSLALAATAQAKVAAEWLQENHKAGDAPPTGEVDKHQTVVLSGTRDAYDRSQPSSCPTIMIGTAVPGGDKDDGWKELPKVTGFDVARLVVDEEANATLPYFIENTKDLSNIKRAVITIAGARRNGWQYCNDMRNALVCAAGRDSVNADMDRVIIAAPEWLNEDDHSAGAVQSNDVYFDNSSYQQGGPALGPGDVKLSSFEALDKLVSSFWNKSVYPELETVVIASHSLGAQMTQRYAMLRPAQPEDANITFGIMNPGSYAWPVSDRPEHDDDCEDTYNDWPYGIDDGQSYALPEYVRDEVIGNRSMVRERYFSRNIFYGFGLDDHGDGDGHCEAQWQGNSHLERGQNFDKMLQDLSDGFPETQSVDYIPGVAHDNYKMFVSEPMQRKMFLFDTSNDTKDADQARDSDDSEPTSDAPYQLTMPRFPLGSALLSVVVGLYA
ncbi:uncharacterized protein BDW70DRAFT_156899 [Aspergillus foveolatus]|uniref:uncharacterized protein n=1 Tax=Aspergillus foveolatus TaxID=210207 RepID=UPI003CCCEF34